MKANYYSLVLVFGMMLSSAYAELSCQAQGNARGARCEWGGCPDGWRSVFWDYGCQDGQYCCI